jgi:small subunit ribosomal protein S4
MAVDTSPKCKQCRRAGEKLFLKGDRCNTPKCAVIKRNFPPGQHGSKGKRQRLSDYGLQLKEKQKAKRQYHMLEKQFRLTFEKAKRQEGNTTENFLKLLELRLDNVVYRAGFAGSRAMARQMVNHGLFTVNDKNIDIPSYSVKTGDIVKIKPNRRGSKLFGDLAEKAKGKEVPGWIHFDKDLSAKILHHPGMDAINPNFNTQIIVEYYSR